MATDLTPSAAWQELTAGNQRFVAGHADHPNQDVARRTQAAMTTQEPFAVVFGCMDSRVAAEMVFDRGIGDLAVVRTAGHVVDAGVLGSLEFGVGALGIPLIVVLGHDRCGAIDAAIRAHADSRMPSGYLREIVERVTASLVTTRLDGRRLEEIADTEVMEQHVRHTVDLIAERSAAIGEAVDAGRCAIVGAAYRLAEGRVRLLTQRGALGDPGAVDPVVGPTAR